mgnify:CR=1 FL=1
MTKGGLRWTEERYREDAAKRAELHPRTVQRLLDGATFNEQTIDALAVAAFGLAMMSFMPLRVARTNFWISCGFF